MRNRVDTPFIQAASGVVFVTLSGVAAAQSAAPSDSLNSYPSYVPVVYGQHVKLNEAAATQSIAVTSLQQMLSISNAVGNRFALRQMPPGRTADNGTRYGLAAGGAADKWNGWVSLSADNSLYNNNVYSASADATNTVLGGDYALSPNLAVGVSVAFDGVRGMNSSLAYQSDGYAIAPYIGWQINQNLSLDGSIGMGNLTFKAAAKQADADKLFYGANLNYVRWMGDWQFLGRGSYLYGEEKYGDTNFFGFKLGSTTNKVEQLRLAGQVGYWANGVMPYAGLAYSTDSRTTTNPVALTTDDMGSNAWLWSVGVNFFSLKNSLTGGVVYSREANRANSNRDSFQANINYRF